MNVGQQIQELRKQIRQPISKRLEEMNYPTGTETGLVHPTVPELHVLLQDDSTAEIASGPEAAVVVDGSNQQTTIKGSTVLVAGKWVSVLTPPGGLSINFQALNPMWLDAPNSPLWFWRNAPLVQNRPSAIFEQVLVAGIPQEGQYNVSLADFVSAQPLFGPNLMLIQTLKNLAEIMRHLEIPG